MDSACATQRKIDIERVAVGAAGGGSIQTPVINVEKSRCVTLVVIAEGAAAPVALNGVSVGDLADGSDMQAISESVSCSKNGADVIIVRLMQVFGKYVRLDLDAGGATAVHILKVSTDFRDSDNIQPDRSAELVCDVICNKP